MRGEDSGLREKNPSGKVGSEMREQPAAFGRAFARRFATRKAATVSSLLVFSLLFLFWTYLVLESKKWR